VSAPGPGPDPRTVERDASRASLAARVGALLRDVPDFPSPGILFKDFTPLLADADALKDLVDDIAERYAGRVDSVAGIEARGFVLGAAVAYRLGLGFVPVRKAGKLPPETHSVSYALEYGRATLEVATSSFAPGQRVLVVDDVLATGGTAAAACELVERTGAVVTAVDVVLELGFLQGRELLAGREVSAVITA
jgi:adenine phosphoribosyltransferase